MHDSDHGGLLRTRDGGEQRATPLELFFDLVYVFAITQLSHLLLDDLTVGEALETLQEALGLTPTVELAAPQTVPRSEGKVVRILDERADAE